MMTSMSWGFDHDVLGEEEERKADAAYTLETRKTSRAMLEKKPAFSSLAYRLASVIGGVFHIRSSPHDEWFARLGDESWQYQDGTEEE